MVVRVGPVTAYQVAKVYEESPVSNFNTSKGKLYPMIKRLIAAGLLEGQRVDGDGRGTEAISVTDQGLKAVREWVMCIRSSHFLLEDPLRTKVQSFDLLSHEERLQWVVAAKEELQRKLSEVEEYGASVEVPFHNFVHDNAIVSISTRIAWLDRVLHGLIKESRSAVPSNRTA